MSRFPLPFRSPPLGRPTGDGAPHPETRLAHPPIYAIPRPPDRESSSAEDRRMARYVLEIVEGPEAGRTVALGDAPLEIGREDGVDVAARAGRARLAPPRPADARRRAACSSRTSGSRNGTFVNGDEIPRPAHLLARRAAARRRDGASSSAAGRPRLAATSVRPIPEASPACARCRPSRALGSVGTTSAGAGLRDRGAAARLRARRPRRRAAHHAARSAARRRTRRARRGTRRSRLRARGHRGHDLRSRALGRPAACASNRSAEVERRARRPCRRCTTVR